MHVQVKKPIKDAFTFEGKPVHFDDHIDFAHKFLSALPFTARLHAVFMCFGVVCSVSILFPRGDSSL